MENQLTANGTKPTVLIISYLYPPSREMGAIRSSEFVKFLPGFGWQPIVVAGRDGFGMSRTKEKGIFRPGPIIVEWLMEWFKKSGRRVGPFKFQPETGIVQSSSSFGLVLGRLAITWLHLWWAIKAIFLAIKLTHAYRARIVYVNCGPFAQVITGVVTKLVTGRPLVLDFRDAWSLDPYGLFSFTGLVWANFWEWLVFRFTNLLVVTSPSAKLAYEKKYSFLKGRVALIYNGYDEDLFASCDFGQAQYPQPTIGYGGTIYIERIRSFLPALASTPGVALNIYGRIFSPDRFWQLIKSHNLMDRVNFRGFMSRPELFREMLRLRALLVTQDHATKSSVTPIAGKTFEYLRLGKPILAIMPEGDNAKLLRDFPQAVVVTSDEVTKLTAALQSVLKKKQLANLEARDLVKPYYRLSLTQELAERLLSSSDSR